LRPGTFGELEQFIKANLSKNGTTRKSDVEPKSDGDSDDSSDSESVRIVFFNDLIACLKVLRGNTDFLSSEVASDSSMMLFQVVYKSSY
jgi:hypothetical protein